MNKMIRTGLLGAAFVAAGFALAACSSNPNTPSGQIGHGASEVGHGIAAAASDTTITTKIKTKIAANTGLSSFHIHVTTNQGVVTLTGTVDTAATRDLAGQTAQNTDGVVRVVNNIKVGSN
ncbi:MAG: BON domain-containing protein [Gammaproteobacteria bacterium]